MPPHLRLTWIFAITALLGLFMDWRLQRAGNWLPTVPQEVGVWSGRDGTLSQEELAILGHPMYLTRTYTNPLGDTVQMSVLAASSMSTYHDPRSCSVGGGYELTAEKLLPLDGGKVLARAMVLRKGYTRVIMYYWLQNNDGSVNTEGAIHHDIAARLSSVRTIFSTVATGRRTCVVRVFAFVKDNDAWGVKTRRNVAFIAQTVYQALRRSGG